MAKVGLENDTLKQPKCPSNWEYSTGQRQLLDIQSGEQMDRLSFSAQTKKQSKRTAFLFFAKTVPHSPVAGVLSIFEIPAVVSVIYHLFGHAAVDADIFASNKACFVGAKE